MDTQRFYDDLAPYYDLIFEDWDASMSRQGKAITALIEQELGTPAGSADARRVLDAACGIGTQALALAARGFEVTGRDLAPGAVARLGREAAARHLNVDAGVADMRTLAATVVAPFDAVIAFDNSIPHLLSDRDILHALSEFRRVLRPGGVCLCSVRDYDLVEHGVASTHPYGNRVRGNESFRLWQEWTWEDPMHYRVTLVVERRDATGSASVFRTTAHYYAVPVARLLELMVAAGFVDCRRLDGAFYQPVLVGRNPRLSH
jgi:SAM-dependent methyltransferase